MPAKTPPPPVASASTPKRDLLLDTAFRLFYQDGYHAVGIDRILAEAGLAKMTLYHHFASKEELIVAALDRRGAAIEAALAEAMAKAGSAPRKRLAAFFAWHEAWVRGDDFNGCAFIRAVGEYPELSSAVHQVVVRRKEASRALLTTLLAAAGLAGAPRLAAQIQLLLEGAIVTAHTSGDPAAITLAIEAANTLIEAGR